MAGISALLQRISRNYLKWNAQLGKEAKIRGTAVVRVDADFPIVDDAAEQHLARCARKQSLFLL
jgi:hypothetical protein